MESIAWPQEYQPISLAGTDRDTQLKTQLEPNYRASITRRWSMNTLATVSAAAAL